jgi:AraC-like DNA-binding protein
MKHTPRIELVARAIGAAFLAAAILLLAFRPSLAIWSGEGPRWNAAAYADAERGGTCRVLEQRSGERRLRVSFSMGTDAPERYAGLAFYPQGSAAGWSSDLSSYERIVLRYRTEGDASFNLLVRARAPSDGDREYRGGERPAYAALDPGEQWRRASFRLKELRTPDWWYEQNPAAVRMRRFDLSRSSALDIVVDAEAPGGRPQTIEVSELRAEGPYLPAILCACLASIPWALVALARRKVFALPGSRRSRRRIGRAGAGHSPEALVAPRWESLDLPSREDEEFERLASLIAEDYAKGELSLPDVARRAGVPEERVSQVLEQKTGLRFRPYVNAVRIGEAARLLVQSDRTVTEIAYLVGYSGLGHFNRVFKARIGTTPLAFRRRGVLSPGLLGGRSPSPGN